jgi:hypothetical protein
MKTPNKKNVICLYGRRNDRIQPKGEPCYWTDWRKLRADRERLTGHAPFWVNVTSESTDPIFRDMSPMRLGPVDCYKEGGRMVTAASVEVAWQYSKVYSHKKVDGEMIDISERFIARTARGKMYPTDEWFRWRDEAYTNPCFAHKHPQFEANKNQVRRAFPRGSVVAFWFWNGTILNSIEARQQIYATLYSKFVVKTPGFQQLRDTVEKGDDLFIFDRDGYDWLRLGMTPVDCLRAKHSFGHGMVTAFLLLGIDPKNLITNSKQ